MTNVNETDAKHFEPDKAYLLWRTFNRFKEVKEGFLKLNKETAIRTFKNQPDLYFSLDIDKFIKNISPLLSGSLILDKDKTSRFINRFHESYRKEMLYSTNRKEQFSMDIIFQVIETLLTEAGANRLESTVMSIEDQKSSVTRQELDHIIFYLKTYNKMTAKFLACGNMKKAIELSDEIITGFAMENHDIPILALDCMFNLITAQMVLAQKYQFKQLLTAWRKEYGFDEDQEARMAILLPPTASLADFRGIYAKAIQTLQSSKQEMESEMDLFLLRTVSNFYTSWINQVANQIAKTAP